MLFSSHKAGARCAKRAPALRVGVDATCWQNNRGYGRHLRALLRALTAIDAESEYTVFLDSPETGEPLPDGCRPVLVAPSRPTAKAAAAGGRRSLGDMFQVGRALSQAECDVLLFPTIYSFVPTLTRARKLVMIHDVIAETYPHLTVPDPAARFFWNLKVWLGRVQADALVTVSNYSRRRIVERFRVSADHVHVVGEAADPVFRRLDNPELTPHLRSLGIDSRRPSVVYVGGFSPHKNIDLLVRAFARCGFSDVQLILVGEYRKEVFHSYFGTIEALVRELGLAERTVFTGYLPDEEVVALLNTAEVLVLPSLMEGFGLPAVEAAACGCPVIATEESPLPELLGDGGLFIRPCQEEVDRALQLVLGSGSLRLRMREAGLRAARALTWQSAARQMREVIVKVAAQ